ncbi:aquaporin [Corynebacterium sp. P3-F1]|uniref:aquaporin n=1 Tax=Corynebacterium sp. P3-F1 TaxID=3059080 RepID=UPI00265D0C0C|nr:aquaporin [Corynebacterium sp. P3-F1]WKK60641.1 aquaporin [Corynebacterium sp. P3-F1]
MGVQVPPRAQTAGPSLKQNASNGGPSSVSSFLLRKVISAQIQSGSASIVEAEFTFILVFVVLNVATANANDDNSFYGLAVGATVMTGAFAVGPIFGGGFNPAVALGFTVNGNFGWSNLWIYIFAPFVGAALAALCFRLLSPSDHEHDLRA